MAINTDDYYSVKEVAEILKVSDQTVKRRIKTKEYKAIQQELPGKQYRWMIPKSQIQVATQTIDTVPMTRAVTVEALQEAMRDTIDQAVENRMMELEERMKKNLEDQFNNHYRLVDQRLREVMENKQHSPAEAPQASWWQRLFG